MRLQWHWDDIPHRGVLSHQQTGLWHPPSSLCWWNCCSVAEHTSRVTHMTTTTGNGTIRKSTYEFLLAFYSNYVTVLHCFCDIARCWLKTSVLTYSSCVLHPLGVTCCNFADIFGTRKLESLGYIVRHCFGDPRFSHLCRKNTDLWWSDGRTHDDNIYHSSIE